MLGCANRGSNKQPYVATVHNINDILHLALKSHYAWDKTTPISLCPRKNCGTPSCIRHLLADPWLGQIHSSVSVRIQTRTTVPDAKNYAGKSINPDTQALLVSCPLRPVSSSSVNRSPRPMLSKKLVRKHPQTRTHPLTPPPVYREE